MPKNKIDPRPQLIWRLVPSKEICQQIGISNSTLKRWRKTGVITEGIHWQYRPGTTARLLWNLDLMRDWVSNSGTPAHARSIELFVGSLPSCVTNTPSAAKNRTHP